MERQIITVDIAPGNNQIQRLKSSQGDIGRPLGVYIIQNGVALDCSAYTADLYILKPDGNFFTGTATVDATEHNLITWETAEQETPVAGDCAAQIRILSNGDDIGTARFVEYVEASPGFCGESSESVIDSLKEYVRQAAASAETASNAASSATGSASAASDSASSAASSASAAAGSASTAHTDAETASQAAQTAQDVADSIPEDYSTLSEDVTGLKSAFEQLNDNVITESAGPAPIVSIADGADGMPMRSVEVAIEPVQDLHGYDAPWPGGGGKNKFPYDSIPSGSGTILSKQPVNIQAGQYTLSCVREIVNAGNVVFTFYDSNDQTVGTATMYMSNTMSPTFTLTGNAASVTAYANANVYLTHIQIEEGTTKTDYAPYSNICPISGWDGVKVTRTGKNLLIRSSATTEKYLNSSGEAVNSPASAGGDYWSISDYIPVDGNITISGILTAGNAPYSAWYGDSFTYISSFKQANNTFTPPAGAKYMRISFYSTDEALQIEYGSSASVYESHQGQAYEVAFPTEAGTVYGGTLDVVSGKLVVDRVIATISDLSVNINFNVGTYTVMKRFFLKIPSNSGIPYNKLHGAIASFGIEGETYYGSQRNNDLGSLKVNYAITSDGKSIAIYDTDLSLTDTAFMEKYGNQQVCYPLAATIEYTLTPQEIKTLLGTNNIWADAGNTAITYPADTKMYIDRKITEAVANALNT